MNKKNLGLYFLYLLVVLSSCEDEFVADNTNCYDNVTFGVKIGSDQQISSRAADEAQPLKEITVKDISSEFRGKPLYLHTIVQDYKPQEEKTQENEKQSRGAVRDKDAVTDLGVSGVIYNEDWTESGRDDQILYFYNLDLDVTNYTASTNYYWPMQNEKMRVFAYSPYSASGMSGFTKTAVSPSFDYEVPAEAADQVDLLVASNEVAKAEYGDPIDLTFGHALTAIQFYVSEGFNNVTIKSMTLKGVKNKGTYQYNYVKDSDSNPTTTDVVCEESGSWNVQDDKTDFVIYNDTEGLNIPKVLGGPVEVNGGENILMLLPQDFSAAADKLTLEMTLVDNENTSAGEKTISVDLTGVWEKGKHLKYEITTNSVNINYTFKVENLATKNIPFYGGRGTYRVQSYKTITNVFGRQSIVPVAWTVTDIPENYELPIGLNKLTGMSGTGVDDVNDWENGFAYSVLPNLEGDVSKSHKTLLGHGTKGTKSAPHDLSMFDISGDKGWNQTTANSYVVRMPGYYMLPLVYGNAIQNGVLNDKAYKPNNISGSTVTISGVKSYVTGSTESKTLGTFEVNVLTNFVDHKNGNGNDQEGEAINSAWITNKYKPGDAYLVWQDEPCLITELELCDETGKTAGEEGVGVLKYMRFRVHEQSVCEGNAIVAVRDENNQIMWSWHIWLTALYDQSKVLVNRRVTGNYEENKLPDWDREESSFDIMLHPLGYCNGDTKTYKPRTIEVKFNQYEETDVNDNPILLEGAQHRGTLFIKEEGAEGSLSENMVVTTTANTPYYQWGRKDPMLPCSNSGVDKPYYNNDGERITSGIKKGYPVQKTIAWTIQHPDYFTSKVGGYDDAANEVDFKVKGSEVSTCVTYRNWCKNIYLNLWNSNCDVLPAFSYQEDMTPAGFHNQFNALIAKGVVKTVYDPCPPGWEMPRVDLFTGFTYEGINMAPFYVPYSVTTSGGWTDKDGNSYTTQFYPKANASTTVEGLYDDLGFYLEPMVGLDKRMSTSATDGNSLYMSFLGHRSKVGDLAEYRTYLGITTSALTCMQFAKESTKAEEFLLNVSRLCVIRGGGGRPSVYRAGDGALDYGTLRPFSNSTMDLAFSVYPVRTGGNPRKTVKYVNGVKSEEILH